MRRILHRLGEVPAPGEALELDDLGAWQRWADAIEAQLERIDRRLHQLTRLEEKLNDLELLFHQVKHLPGSVQQLHGWKNTRLFCCRLSYRSYRSLLSSRALFHPHLLQRFGDEVLMAVLTTRGQAPETQARLERLDFEELKVLPSLSGSFEDATRRCAHLAQQVRAHRILMEGRVEGIRAENRKVLHTRLASLESEIKMLEARREFQFTERTVVLSGWVPENKQSELKAILKDVCGSRYGFRQLAVRGDAPILLRNPGWARPFERVLSVLGTPGYREVEPTPLLALGFVLMFGMMFGDLGHGLVFMALGACLYRFSRFRDQGLILIEVGAAAAVFGLLFGSVFGFEELIPALWFSPLHHVPLLMALAMTLGVFLIVTGLCLRIVNGFRRERTLSVLMHRNGVAGLLFYIGAVAGGFLLWKGVLPAAALSVLILPLAAIFLHPLVNSTEEQGRFVALVEGGIEVLETVLGFLANTFSFLRVAAFGLAHVGLALAVFALADAVREFPLGMFWVVLVYIFGNLFIMALEGLVVSIQAVRLEFYEFFSKFFVGGGVPYRPLSLKPGLERSV